jgi:hypothetical protein
MPSADRVLVLGKRSSASKRGEWNNHSKELTYPRIGVTVPITQEVGVINMTWGQMR